MSDFIENSGKKPVPNKFISPVNSLEEAVQRYGPIINGKWQGEANWMVLYQTPNWFKANVVGLDGRPCIHIYCNKDMEPVLDAALDLVEERGLKDQLKSMDGCYIIRFIRGSTSEQSTHSFGCALDLNASENKLGDNPSFSKELVACFKDVGFTWGGEFTRKDGMHFEFAWNKPKISAN